MFLNPGGDATLCDRSITIGNLVNSPLTDIVQSRAYRSALAGAHNCPGCWMICYVEPMLRVMPWKAWRHPKRRAA